MILKWPKSNKKYLSKVGELMFYFASLPPPPIFKRKCSPYMGQILNSPPPPYQKLSTPQSLCMYIFRKINKKNGENQENNFKVA